MSRNLTAYYSEADPNRSHHFIQPSGRFALEADFTSALHGRTIVQARWKSWMGGQYLAMSDGAITGGKVRITVSPGYSTQRIYGEVLCEATLSDGTLLLQVFCPRPDHREWVSGGQEVTVTA